MNASEVERRQFFADRLADYFRAHPLVWVSIMKLIEIGGPSWRSRICEDLRKKRGMEIPWNRDNKHSAYMFKPFTPLARDAGDKTNPLPLLDGLDGGAWQR